MADLLDTDVLLVNRAGVDHSVTKATLMATVQDTDLLLVNRGGVDYKATYADVKKGFGPQQINPAPGDWTFNPAIAGGTGTQADPFIITPEMVNTPGGTVESAQTLTLTGLTPNGLVEWTDHSTGTGDRFKQNLGLVPASGQVDLKLRYLDTPDSTVGATFTGDLQIGTSYFRWVVTQNVGSVNKPSLLTPADGAGQTLQGNSDVITAVASATNPVFSTGWDYTSPYTQTGAFDGSAGSASVATFYGIATNATATWTAPAPIPFTTLRIFGWRQASGQLIVNNVPQPGYSVSIDGVTDQNTGSALAWYTVTGITSPLTKIELVGPSSSSGGCVISGVEVNGVVLVDGASSTTLTFASDKDLTDFASGDAVNQDSAYQPTSDTITAVSASTVPADWFARATKVNAILNDDPLTANTWDKAFNGTASSAADGIYGRAAGEVLITFAEPIPCTTLTLDVYTDVGNTGANELIQLNGVNYKNGTNGATFPAGAGVHTFTIPNSGPLVSFGPITGGCIVRRVIADGNVLIAGTAPSGSLTTLTFATDKDLAIFSAGDVVTNKGVTPIRYGKFDVVGTGKKPNANSVLTITGSPVFDMTSTAPQAIPDHSKPGEPDYTEHLVIDMIDGTTDLSIGATGGGWSVSYADSLSGPWTSPTMTSSMLNPPVNIRSLIGTARYAVINWVPFASGSSNWSFTYSFEVTLGVSWVNKYAGMSAYAYADGIVASTDPTAKTMTLASFNGTWANGNIAYGPSKTASGTVASTDSTAKTMTLSASTGSWAANAGKYVIGAPKISTDAAVDETPTFTSSAFSITGAGLTHASSDWQVTLKADTGFASPVVQSMADATNLVSWQGGPLQADTDYIARVRHNGSGGLQSPWSDVIGFKTKSSFSDYLVAPGDLWVAGSTAGVGKFRTNTVKMVGAAWGDQSLALGADGKFYKGSLTYDSMADFLTPAVPVVAFGGLYGNGSLCYIDTAGAITLFGITGSISLSNYPLPGGSKAVAISWDPADSTSHWWVLDDAGKLWHSNAMGSTTVSSFIQYTAPDFKKFSCATSKIYGIKADNTLWVLDVDPGDLAGPGTATQVMAGTTFNSVHSGYNATTYAIKSDGKLQRIVDTTSAYPVAGPPSVTLKELAFAYYNLCALSDDGRIFVTGGNASPSGPYKGAAPTATTWAEYDLPKPCPGFGTSKYSGSGYDYAFILP